MPGKRDPDFPDFLFNKCSGCGSPISDPEAQGVTGQLPKGGGFTSTEVFCSADCAAGSEVLAAIQLQADESDEDEYDEEEDEEEEDEDEEEEDGDDEEV